ncbi:Erv1/Alr family protein [Aphelenchoides avenae]|nr:Erv1/Alr family protein [Aphelenchus avenae]
MRLLVIVLLLFGCSVCSGLKSDVLYPPKGDYPHFYDEGPYNHVINLDEETFKDTVFNNDLPIVVEIYRDW